jgi:hypothetical protein
MQAEGYEETLLKVDCGNFQVGKKVQKLRGLLLSMLLFSPIPLIIIRRVHHLAVILLILCKAVFFSVGSCYFVYGHMLYSCYCWQSGYVRVCKLTIIALVFILAHFATLIYLLLPFTCGNTIFWTCTNTVLPYTIHDNTNGATTYKLV